MISVVIPAYNNIDSVRQLLVSIYKQFDGSRGEVIVVDDGSGVCDMQDLRKEFKDIVIERIPVNSGAANARNAGAKKAKYDIIFFLDADMRLCENAIDEVVKTMSDPKICAVVGTVRDIPLNRGIFQDYWALLKTYFHSLPKGYSSTFYPMLGAIRKNAYEDAGGFDNKIKGASVEDYEFSFRLLAKGYKVAFNPKIMCDTHYKDFFSSIKQSVERSRKWTVLFLDRKKFDNHTTTASQGAANVLGFLICIALAFGVINKLSLIISAAMVALLLFINRGFFIYVIQRRGIFFFIAVLFIYIVSSFFITIGAFSGILYVFRNKEARREALYG